MSDEQRCVPRMTSVCGEEELAAATETGACPTWKFCLPFGAALSQRDGCVEYTPGVPPEDGTYDKIIIVDGCIVGLEKDGIPWYTATPCAPVPDDCSGEGGIGTPSPIACNILQYDAAGRPYVCVTIQGGDGIDVVGTGSAQDPIIITNTAPGGGSGGGYVKACNDGITVSGTGTRDNPYCVGHKVAEDAPQTANGLSVDRYGHIIGFTESTSNGLQAILPGDGIHVVNDPTKGTATVSLEDIAGLTPGTYEVDNYEIVVDSKGRVSSIKRLWTVEPHTFRVDCVDYTVNENGVINNIREVPADECTRGGNYEVLKSHMVRVISPTSWGSSEYTGSGNDPVGNAEVASFVGLSSDGTRLSTEWNSVVYVNDEMSGSFPLLNVSYYDINFVMLEPSALFIRLWGDGSWYTRGNCGNDAGTCTIIHDVTRWIIELDGARIVDDVQSTCLMVRTRDVYAAGAHTLRVRPINIDGAYDHTDATGIIEIMTTALFNGS